MNKKYFCGMPIIIIVIIIIVAVSIVLHLKFWETKANDTNIYVSMSVEEKEEWEKFLTEIPKIEPNIENSTIKLLDNWYEILYSIELEENWKLKSENEFFRPEHVYSLKNGKFSLDAMYRRAFEEKYGNALEGNCSYSKENIIIYESVQPRQKDDLEENVYYGEDFDLRLEFLGFLDRGGALNVQGARTRFYDISCIDDILKKHYGVLPNKNKLLEKRDGRDFDFVKEGIMRTLKYNVYLFNSGDNSMISSMFMPLSTKRIVPVNIYEYKKNVYYIEAKEIMYNEIEEFYSQKHCHAIVRRDNLDDEWRLYKWGEGWIERDEAYMYIKNIK